MTMFTSRLQYQPSLFYKSKTVPNCICIDQFYTVINIVFPISTTQNSLT